MNTQPDKCVICGDPHWLRNEDAGSQREIERKCMDCYMTYPKISEPVAPIDKTLSAEQYIRRLYPLSDKFSRLGCEKIAESYANLRVEQAKEEWKKEKACSSYCKAK